MKIDSEKLKKELRKLEDIAIGEIDLRKNCCGGKEESTYYHFGGRLVAYEVVRYIVATLEKEEENEQKV